MEQPAPWSRAIPAAYHALDLRAHALLADVPLHDVWRVYLPGTDRSCSVPEIRTLVQAMASTERLPWPVRFLFELRHVLGRLFGWDAVPARTETWSRQSHLSDADRQRSLVAPGTPEGPFQVLYVYETEAAYEIRNATVQAYLVWAVRPLPGGHELLWAIHVLPVGAWTRAYLALIDPFRRWIVYPALLRQLHRAWVRGAPAPR